MISEFAIEVDGCRRVAWVLISEMLLYSVAYDFARAWPSSEFAFISNCRSRDHVDKDSSRIVLSKIMLYQYQILEVIVKVVNIQNQQTIPVVNG